MVSTSSYKYINLLFRITLGIGAVIYIYFKLKDEWLIALNKVKLSEVNVGLLFIAFLLVFINWGMEALKWKYAIHNSVKISFFKAFKFTLTGITAGLLTPNRVGEIPFRALMLGKNKFKEVTLKTILSSYSQALVTVIIGTVGLLFMQDLFIFKIDVKIICAVLVLCCVFMLLLYFKVGGFISLLEKIKYFKNKQIGEAINSFSEQSLVIILFFSLIRYMVFSIQYYIILNAFNIEFSTASTILLIPVCFMLASIIPTILISEIAVRASVAIFVFGIISDLDVSIMAASITLWGLNVAFPALLGMFNLQQIKILSAS